MFQIKISVNVPVTIFCTITVLFSSKIVYTNNFIVELLYFTSLFLLISFVESMKINQTLAQAIPNCFIFFYEGINLLHRIIINYNHVR